MAFVLGSEGRSAICVHTDEHITRAEISRTRREGRARGDVNNWKGMLQWYGRRKAGAPSGPISEIIAGNIFSPSFPLA